MLKSKISYLTLEEGEELYSAFDGIYFHQYQDPLRSVFVHQPCFTCSLNGEVIAYAVLELHRFRKASIWLGPIFKYETDKAQVWIEFFKQLRKFRISHLTLQPEKNEVFESTLNFIKKSNGPSLIRTHWGMSTAIKKLHGTEEEIFNTYSKHHQKEVQNARKKEIKIRPVESKEDFEKLVQLFLLMFQQKKIHHYPSELAKRLRGEYDYINYSGNGKVVLAEKDGNLVGASVELYAKNSSFYVFGATDKNVKFPVSYSILHTSFISLVQKEIIYFDFGGYQQDEPDEQFAKVSKFKGGFGVDTRKYPERLIINPGGISGKVIENLLVVRNIILKALGKHVS